ncbi:MAG: ABC transporter permease [Candidatus Rokubacteria bacterium]|nr:ABC transporter permease [Candidatus Rokubacteria bacterium]
MTVYVVRRIAAAAGVLLLDVVLIFSLIHFTPGDPARLIVGDERGGSANVDKVREQLGLNRPLPAQFAAYIAGLVRGDMGRSFFSREPVFDMLASRVPLTLALAIISLVIGLAVALPTGVLAAVKRGSIWDQAFMLLAMLGVSMPSFWFATVLMLVFAVALGWFPVVGYATFTDSPGRWLWHLVLPATAIGVAQAALTARMTRASLLEVLRLDYVTLTARAKGLPEWRVILKHALANAAFPIVTIVGMNFAFLLGGVVIIETVFALPGVGSLLINSVARRDYHVIQGVLLFVAAANVMMNLVVDLSYVVIDKRVRYGAAT